MTLHDMLCIQISNNSNILQYLLAIPNNSSININININSSNTNTNTNTPLQLLQPLWNTISLLTHRLTPFNAISLLQKFPTLLPSIPPTLHIPVLIACQARLQMQTLSIVPLMPMVHMGYHRCMALYRAFLELKNLVRSRTLAIITLPPNPHIITTLAIPPPLLNTLPSTRAP